MKTRLIATIICSPLLLTACGGSENSTTGCFNPALYQAGNTFTYINYRDNAPYDVIEVSYKPLADAPQVEEHGVYKDLQGKTEQQYVKTLTVDKAHQQILQHSNRFSKDKVEFLIEYTPAQPDVLEANATTATPVTTDYEMRAYMPSDPDNTATHTEEHKVTTFIGYEQLTTPAGTFSTCHFTDTIRRHDIDSDTTSVTTSHRWYDDKLGMQVQLANEQQTRKRVLVQAQVNGDVFSAPDARLQQVHIKPINNSNGV